MSYKRGPRTLGSEGVGLRSPKKKHHGTITSGPSKEVKSSMFKTVEQVGKKRLSITYQLSGVPKSNDYKLTIENINREEAGEFKKLISELNRRIKK